MSTPSQAHTPRITRQPPMGRISRPEMGLPVIARIEWDDGQVSEVLAVAMAWTDIGVEIIWDAPAPYGRRQDWIPAAHVRRTVENRRTETHADLRSRPTG